VVVRSHRDPERLDRAVDPGAILSGREPHLEVLDRLAPEERCHGRASGARARLADLDAPLERTVRRDTLP
jgi:hypothetical protein